MQAESPRDLRLRMRFTATGPCGIMGDDFEGTTMNKTIHVIFNAHLDPIWMWPWTSGLDEALATCRSACDRLDRNPDLFFTQGEAWTFDMVKRADPVLFERIRAHIVSGRWEVVNGWWTQPDCNHPTADGLRRQIATGLAWVKENFNLQPRCGFNPDSFGHCALLPEILREYGQDRYVFMRPQEHEKKLPARLFAWRTRAGGRPVTAFRIADGYGNGTGGSVWVDAVRHALNDLPDGVQHTMAFFGIGNHGGGPTERLVQWVRDNRDLIPGATLQFSTVNRFFDAVAAAGVTPPEVVGELQMHAIGCYTIVRDVKAGSRRAEHALVRAETVATPADRPALDRAWQAVCSHQFHDTMGGTCAPEAYRTVLDQLGGAAAVAEEMTVYAVRRQMACLPDDELPRLVLANPGRDAFAGWCEAAVYLENAWKRPWRLLGADGREVPFQEIAPSVGIDLGWCWTVRRILVKAAIPAGGLLPLRMDLSQPRAAIPTQARVEGSRLTNDAGASVEVGPWGATLAGAGLPPVRLALQLIEDASDTWSHRLDRYADGPVQEPRWAPPTVIDHGPLMGSLVQQGEIGDSRISAEWRVYAGDDAVELRLEVNWRERLKLLKLVLPLSGEPERQDGTPGMGLVRVNDGAERPLHDWSRFAAIGVTCPDCFALDATPRRARFTLLRAPLMAHHDPCGPGFSRAVVADQGVHTFRFRFHPGSVETADLAREALAWQRPPLIAELTRGMPMRMMEWGR